MIGTGGCGLQISSTDCVLGVLPAGGPSIPLPQNYVLDGTQSIKNTLVGQLITLVLNVRYNEVFNSGLHLGALELGCLFTTQELDTDGRLVKEIRTEVKKGENTRQIDVSHLPAGLCWIDLSSEESKGTKRLVMVRL